MAKEKNRKNKDVVFKHGDNFFRKNLYSILIFISAFLLYANSIPNNYNLDDELVTIQHKLTSKGFKAIPDIISSPYYSDNVGYSYEYRPMVHISFAIEHGLFGENPATSHFINVLLYALLCLVLFVTLRLLLFEFNSGIPFVATLLFVVHPIHTEVVNSIKNRDEILALTAGLLALNFGLKFMDRQKWIYLLLSVLFFALGLLSKQSVLSFAVLIPVSIIFFRRYSVKQLLVISLLLFVPFVALAPLNTLRGRIGLFAGGMSFIVIMHLLLQYGGVIVRHIQPTLQLLGRAPQKMLSTIRESAEDHKDFVFAADGSSLNRREQLLAFSFTVIAGIGIFYAIASQISALVTLFVIAYILFALCSKDVFKQLLLIPCFLFTVISVASFNIAPDFYINVFLYVAAVYTILFKGAFRWSGISVIILCFGLSIWLGKFSFSGVIDIISIILLANRKTHRYLKIAIIVTLGISLLPLLTSIPQGFEYDDQIRHVFLIVMLATIYRPVAMKFFPLAASFILIFSIVLTFLLAGKERSFYHSPVYRVSLYALDQRFNIKNRIAEKSVNAVEDVLQTPLKSETTDRPLAFIETPVLPTDPISIRLGTSLVILGHYLYKTVMPYPMSYYYGYRYIEPTSLSEMAPLLSLFAYLLLLGIALWLMKKQPVISFALILYLVSVVVFSNYFYPVPGLMGDRFLLIPSLGWCLLLPALLQRLFKLPESASVRDFWSNSVVLRSAIVLVLLAYAALSFSRNFQWKDPITLFSHDINYVGQSAHAHNLLALRYNQRASNTTDPVQQKADYERGIYHFRKAVEIYPDFFNVNYDLGRTYLILQKPDSAVYFFQRAAVLDSTFMPSFDKAGEILFQQRKFSQAVPYFMHVVKNRPTQYEGYDKLSFLYYTMGEYEKAIAVNRDALRFMPQLAAPYINLGRTFQGINRPDSAAFYYERGLAIQPGNTEVRQLLEQVRKSK